MNPMNQATHDIRINEFRPLMPPEQLMTTLPLPEDLAAQIMAYRKTIDDLLNGRDNRLLVIVGPCSIHDTVACFDYAQKLKVLADRVKDRYVVVMRVYFEKPRTTIGWKGLINDPNLDGSCDVQAGLIKARSFLLDVARLGLPAATEFLDPIVPQYIADLVSWVAIGARTTESQTHREMASGLSMPVGFKNATDGGLQIAADAMVSASHPHSFLGIDKQGVTSVVSTRGNPLVHLILRGGASGPNYSPDDIAKVKHLLQKYPLKRPIMVDCSHGNSNKDYRLQAKVWQDVVGQFKAGESAILGLMLESHLVAGKQNLGDGTLTFGQSITDGCIGFDETASLLHL